MPNRILLRLAALVVATLLPLSAAATFTYSPTGQGILTVAAGTLPPTGDPKALYRVTGQTNGTDCDNVASGSAVAYCAWNGSAYAAVGVAATGLTNPLTNPLDAAGFAITNPGLVDGRDISVDGAKLDGIAAGATVGLGADPAACPAGQVVTDQNQSGVLVCAPDGTAAADVATLAALAAAVPSKLDEVADDPSPQLGADLDALGRFIDNLGGIGEGQFYVRTQAELNTALAACDAGIGQNKQTGCTIWADRGNYTLTTTTALCGDGSAATGRNGLRLFGMGGGYGPANASQYPNAGTIFSWAGGAAPMLTAGACSLEIQGIQFRGLDTATSAIAVLNSSGAPVKMDVRNVSMHGFTGCAIQGNDGGATPSTGQWDESTFSHVYIERSACAISTRNSQTIGITLGPKFQVTSMTGAGPFIDLQWGSARMVDSYCGLVANGQTCIRFGKNANKLVIQDVQFEGPGFTGLTFIEANEGAPAGNIRKLVVDQSQFIISSSGNTALDFVGRGSVEWGSSNNMVDTVSATNDDLLVSIVRDSGTNDRLDVKVGLNWLNRSGMTETPTRWLPSIGTNARVASPTIVADALPLPCGWWETGRLTTAPSGQDMHACVGGAWVRQNSASHAMAGDLSNFAPVDVATVLSPNHRVKNFFKTFFAIDGAKNEGCPDVSPADGWCDSDPTQRVGKTKAVGVENEVVILTQTEGYGDWVRLIAGADVDAVGRATDLFVTGGAQDGGDEAAQDLRNFVTDSYYAARGAIAGTVPAGGGTTILTVTGLTETESKLVGENKLLVFENNTSAGALAQDVDLTSVPAGTIDTNPLPATLAPGNWSTPGNKTWGIEVGLIASQGFGGGWCMSPANSAYLDPNGEAAREWYKVVSCNAGANTCETEWWAQGVNYGVAYGTLAEIGANEARFAPCVTIAQPLFTGGPSDFVTDLVAAVRDSGFPGTSADAGFYVPDYPNHTLYGAQFLIGRRHGSTIPHYGLNIRNYTGEWGARQGGDAVTVGGVGAASALIDGASFHWLHGYRCIPEGAETCFRHDYKDDANGGQFGLVNPGNTRFALDDTFNVLRIADAYEDSLAYKPSLGWGEGIATFEPFLKASVTDDSINGGVPNGAGAKIHWSQILGMPPEFADNIDNVTAGDAGDALRVNGSAVDAPAGLNLIDSLSMVWAYDGAASPETAAPRLNYGLTRAANPAMNARECVFSTEGTGHGGAFLCEGQNADNGEQLYQLPQAGADVDGTLYVALSTSPIQDAFSLATALTVFQLVNPNLTDLSDGVLTGSKVEVFGASNAGAVPASGGGTVNFLRADGVFAEPPGGGGGGGTTVQVDGVAAPNPVDIQSSADVDSILCTSAGVPDASCLASGDVVFRVKADSVALGTDTTGNYAGSASEAGPATLAVALVSNASNCAAGSWASGVDASGAAEGCTPDDDTPELGDFAAATDLDASGAVEPDSVALGTDTTGGYAGSATEGGSATTALALAANAGNCGAGLFSKGVDATGAAEGCEDVVVPAEVNAYTTGTSTPVDGSTACNTGDMHLETDRRVTFFCVDGATDDWWGVQLLDDVP